MILILDASSSICDASRMDNTVSSCGSPPDEATQVRDSAIAVVNALQGTGATVAIIEFGTRAVEQGYTLVDDAGAISLTNFINAYKHPFVKRPGDNFIFTNWDIA